MNKRIISISLGVIMAAALAAGCSAPAEKENTASPAAAASAAENGTAPAGSGGETQIAIADAGAAESEPAATPAATETPAPTPTPEPVLPDGTIHSELTEAGSIFVTENRAFCPYYYADESGDAFSAMLNHTAESLGPGVKVYSILAPTSFAVCLGEEVQESMYCSDERYAIEYVNERLSASVTPVRILDTLIRHNAEYLYFGTDHHWTQLSAYYAYREFCTAKGIVPHELSEYPYTEFPGFLGLFYQYSDYNEALAANPDTVQAYIPMATNEMTMIDADGAEYPYNIVSDVSGSDAGFKYSTFIGGDAALCTIRNPLLADGSACILIKDSFGNAFAPFLVDHYQTVFVVDPRYYAGSIPQLAAENGVTDVILLYNVDQILGSTAEEVSALF